MGDRCSLCVPATGPPNRRTEIFNFHSPSHNLIACANFGKRNQYCAMGESKLRAHRKLSLEDLDPLFDALRCILAECSFYSQTCMRSTYAQVDLLRASRAITAAAQVWQRACKITASPSWKRSHKPTETVSPPYACKIAPSSCATVSCSFSALAATSRS